MLQCRVCIQDNSKLYLNMLDLELSSDLRLNGGGVQQCVSKALAAPLSSDSKILFSQRGLQFAEDFGTTVQRSDITQDKIDEGFYSCFIYVKSCVLLHHYYLFI